MELEAFNPAAGLHTRTHKHTFDDSALFTVHLLFNRTIYCKMCTKLFTMFVWN